MKNLSKAFSVFAASFLLLSCSGGGETTTTTSGTSPDKEEDTLESLLDFDFDSHTGPNIINKADNQEYKIKWLFNEENADKIFKAPSDPLFKQGVGNDSKSLYLDGHSTKMEFREINIPKQKFTISAWIAPRGFENLAGYRSFDRDYARMTSILNQGDIEAGEGFVFGYGRLGKWGIQMCLHNKDTLEDGVFEYYDPLHSLELYKWNHIAVTFDGAKGFIGLYYNGQRAYEAYTDDLVGAELISSYENMYMGYYCAPQYEFGCNRQLPAGLIDNFKLSKGVATPKDIHDEYLKGCRDNKHPDLPFSEVEIDRSMYEGDRYRAIYHGIPSGVWMNEPHAPIYYKGMYHLYYQHDPIGPYWSQIRWAHLASPDMIHWVSVKDPVVPTPGICPEGVWTGGSVIGPDGTPWLVITAGTNQYGNPSWSGQNVAYAHCVDPDDPYLTDWVVEDVHSLTQLPNDVMGEREQFRDPFVWYDDGTYYMLVSTSIPGAGGSANVFTSKNMRDWQYHGYLYDCPFDRYPVQGAHWECVVMFPISTKDGSVTKWILFDCPQYTVDGYVVDCIYWIGNFNKTTCKFEPDSDEPRLFDLGNGVYTGQTGFCYLTEDDIAHGKTKYEQGRTILYGLSQGKAAGTEQNIWAGWAHSLGMPVELHLADDGYTVLREPIAEMASLYDQTLFDYDGEYIGAAAMNELIKDVRGDAVEIKAHVKLNPTAPEYKGGIYVRYNKNTAYGVTEKTGITFGQNGVYVNRLESTASTVDKSDSHTYATGDQREFDITILLDRSNLEVYVDNKITITTRIYPRYGNSDFFNIFDNDAGITFSNLTIKNMKSAYYDTVTPAYYGNTGDLITPAA